MCLELGGSVPNVKITPRSPRRGPKMPPRASCTRERAPKKLGVTAWEVQIAPKSPRGARKRPPGAPWKPPRAPDRPPREGKRGPKGPQTALKTTENTPRTTMAIIIIRKQRIMKGLKRPYARSYVKYMRLRLPKWDLQPTRLQRENAQVHCHA